MMADRLEARIQQLLDQGKTPDEIRAMRDQLVSETSGPDQSLGPTPQGSPDTGGVLPDWQGPPAPGPPPEPGLQGEPGLFMSPLEAIVAGAKGAAGLVGRARKSANDTVNGWFGMHPAEVMARLEASAAGGDASAKDGLLFRDAVDAGQKLAGGMALGGALGGALSKGLGAATATTAGGRVAASALGGAGAAAGAQLATDVATGDPEGMEGRALSAAAGGGAVSGGMSTLGELGGGLARTVAGSRGAQARQLLERNGSRVGVTTPGEGGEFAPGGRLAGREATDVDLGAVSRQSSSNVLNGLEGDLESKLSGPLGEKAALDAANKGHVVVNDLVAELQNVKTSERLTDSERATVEGFLRRLDKYEIKNQGVPTGVYAMPPRKLNDFRGMLQDATGVGTDPGTVAKAKIQGAADVAKQLVDQTDYGAVNEGIAGARRGYEGSRRLLGLGDRPAGGAVSPEGPPAAELNKLTNMMARQGQNTVTAGGQNSTVDESLPAPVARERLQQFADRNPQYKRDVEAPEMLRARGDLKFKASAPESGGLINRLHQGAGVGGAALMAGGAASALKHIVPQLGLDPETAAIIAGGGKAAYDLLKLNAPAIQGRLLYTPAMAAGRGGAAASGVAGAAGGAAGATMNPLQALLLRLQQQQGQENAQ